MSGEFALRALVNARYNGEIEEQNRPFAVVDDSVRLHGLEVASHSKIEQPLIAGLADFLDLKKCNVRSIFEKEL